MVVTTLQVKQMSSEDTEHKDLFKRNLSHSSLAALAPKDDQEAEYTVRQVHEQSALKYPPVLHPL